MSYFISNLETYPQDGKHQRIVTYIYPFPFAITKGEDEWWYNDERGVSVKISPKLWYVYPQSHSFKNALGHFQVKGFRKPEAAVKYAIKSYKAWLKTQLKKVTEFIIEEESL